MKPHVFAVCAYHDSPYLESCLRSLVRQSQPTSIILCTSTPSAFIDSLAEKYRIPVYVREGRSGIGEDWEFAYHTADAGLVTIAHQDDLYGRDYVKRLLAAYEAYPDMTVFTGGYAVVKGNQLSRFEKVEFVKRFLRLPLRIKAWSHLRPVKRSVLMFGNSICCPACTYNKAVLGEPLFHSSYRFVLDWDTLISLADRPGRFICEERPLLYYRVHDGAETKACMEDGTRSREETELFAQFWPQAVVTLLMKFYCGAYKEYL